MRPRSEALWSCSRNVPLLRLPAEMVCRCRVRTVRIALRPRVRLVTGAFVWRGVRRAFASSSQSSAILSIICFEISCSSPLPACVFALRAYASDRDRRLRMPPLAASPFRVAFRLPYTPARLSGETMAAVFVRSASFTLAKPRSWP